MIDEIVLGISNASDDVAIELFARARHSLGLKKERLIIISKK
jgi:hypothetical protein